MLSRLFEWYRAVHVQPDESTLAKRKASVATLVKGIEKPKQVPTLVGFGSVAVGGFRGDAGLAPRGPIKAVHNLIVDAIRKEATTFPSDLSENALETRVVAALAVGEVIARTSTKDSVTGMLAATFVRAGLPMQPVSEERYLQKMLGELSDHAAQQLEDAARQVRDQGDAAAEPWDELAPPEGADLSAYWPDAVERLRDSFDTLATRARIDREELQVLSWLYAGVSEAAGERLAAMPAAAAALAAGGEIGNAALLPPVESLRAMVARAVHSGRQANEIEPVDLATFAEQWTTVPAARELYGLLAVPAAAVRELVAQYPILLPLSSLCYRLADGGDVASSVAELERQAGIDLRQKRPLDDWAVQIFNERTAQRLYAEHMEG